jgi:hypothetical protein
LCRDKPAAFAPLHSCYYHTLAVHYTDMVYMQAELRAQSLTCMSQGP